MRALARPDRVSDRHMPTGESCASAAATDDDDDVGGSGSGSDGRRLAAGCFCLPFYFWKSRSKGPERRSRRRRRRFRLRLSWFSWPWRSRGGNPQGGSGGEKTKKKKKAGERRKKLLRLLIAASLQTKKALAPVSSGGSLLAKVSSLGGAKKRNQSKPRRTVDDYDAPTTSCDARGTAPGAIVDPPCLTPARDVRRAPSSSRLRSLQPDRGGLWTAAATLGMIVFFGRVAAVVFLCSCLYGARRLGAAHATGGETRGDIAVAGTSGGRLGDWVTVELCTEEYKKKVIMDGLLDRTAGKRPSSRFCK